MRSLKRNLPVVCTIVIGTIASLIIFKVIHSWEHKVQQVEFTSHAKARANALQKNLNFNLEALMSVKAFFDNSEYISRKEFSGFVNNTLSRHPSIQAISWNPLVQDNERADYESLAQKEGFGNFQFTERSEENKLIRAGQRQEYVVVYYIAPLESNKPALGYDIASDQTRLKAIHQGFNTGKLSVTDKITLVQETGNQAGVLLLLPIYQQNTHPENPEERHRYRKGFLVEVLRLGDVVEDAMKDFSGETIDVYLYDMSAEKEENRFLHFQSRQMSSKAASPEKNEVIQGGLYWSKNFNFADRQWKVLFRPSSSYNYSHSIWHAWLVLSVSLFFTFSLTFYLLKKLKYTDEIEQRVKKQAQTNTQLKKEITERKQAEEDRKKMIVKLQKALVDIKAYQEQLEIQAFYDPLTNLPNRRLFFDRLNMTLEHNRRNKGAFSVFFLDLDGLKTVNDSLGHKAGDELLCTVAKLLKKLFRNSDTVARFGGDEFAIIFDQLKSAKDAEIVAEKIIDTFAAPIQLNTGSVNIGFSIGISLYPLNSDEAEELVRLADSAMYTSKKQGKNTYTFFCEDTNS